MKGELNRSILMHRGAIDGQPFAQLLTTCCKVTVSRKPCGGRRHGCWERRSSRGGAEAPNLKLQEIHEL